MGRDLPVEKKPYPLKPRQGIIPRFEQLNGFTKGAITWVGALATTIAAVVGATYLISPDLKPREKLGATLDRIGIEQDFFYSTFVSDLKLERPTSKDPSLRGVQVLVHASLSGYKDRSYSLRVKLLRPGVLTEFKAPFESDIVWSCENRSPKANEEGVTWRCWTAAPKPGTPYIVRAEIYDSGQTHLLQGGVVKEVLLDFIDSPEMTSPPEIDTP